MSDPTPQPPSSSPPARDLLPVQPSRRSRLSRGSNTASSSSSTTRERAQEAETVPEESSSVLGEEIAPLAAEEAVAETTENSAAVAPAEETFSSPPAAVDSEEEATETLPASKPLPRPRPIPPSMRPPREPLPPAVSPSTEAQPDAPFFPPSSDFEPAGGFPLTFRERFLAPGDLPADLAPGPMLPAQTPDAAWRGRPWVLSILALLFVLAGAVAGYFIGRSTSGSNAPANNASERVEFPAAPPPTAAALAEVEAAFAAASDGRYATAAAAFETTGRRYPSWPTLTIEQARNVALAGKLDDADILLRELVERISAAGGNPRSRGFSSVVLSDAIFLRALLHVRAREQDLALEEFSQAAAADPTRADIFFFWGHILRRAGKPGESVEKLRSALRRNQQEGNRGLYQAQLWFSQLEAGGDEAVAASAQLDKAVKQSQPAGDVWVGLAARALRAGQFKEVADNLRRARAALDPSVYRFLLSDPIFESDIWRPELAEFFR